MKFYSTLLLTLFLSIQIHAQDREYIVSTTNDTTYGKVIRGTHYLNPSKVIFKIKDDTGKKQKHALIVRKENLTK